MMSLLLGLALAASPAPADTVIDTVFVASNRQRAATGFTRAPSDSLWFGVYVTRLVSSDIGPRALAAMHVARIDSTALGQMEWLATLDRAARQRRATDGVLLYVHGYSSSPGTAVAQGVQVRARGDFRGPLVVFVWPTHSRYVGFPNPAGVYNDDARAARESGAALGRVVRAVHAQSPALVVVAHSMGSRIALNAVVRDSLTRRQLVASPLRALGLFSPDVGAAVFRDSLAPQLPAIARRVAVYGTSSDYLLGMARMVNGERRAGEVAVRGPSLPGIELIDATHGDRAEPVVLSRLGPRHAVRWASAALVDFFDIVVAGELPSCRSTLALADTTGVNRWRLRSGSIARPLADTPCSNQHNMAAGRYQQ